MRYKKDEQLIKDAQTKATGANIHRIKGFLANYYANIDFYNRYDNSIFLKNKYPKKYFLDKIKEYEIKIKTELLKQTF